MLPVRDCVIYCGTGAAASSLAEVGPPLIVLSRSDRAAYRVVQNRIIGALLCATR